ncbi:hypothetical protein [Ornithinimicrobium cryptoxanthini]|uniref:LemA protein n=1 Tax=Ornithinimicrobium cryptoxanthini TaxID=2934161 RepID=A0ABY4YMP6_9MICO|nr:hypothetical protein [Ornithinimicrobium cryptoxanthini]USQ77869.1 hypothetical protein NF557_08260 [Ornithinimicrobium cryptoxanthini]
MISDWGPLEFAIIGAVLLALLLAVGWYLSYTAVRIDRLHHRVIGTAAALDAQLVRRAEAALEVAYVAGIDPASATLLAAASAQALDHDEPWSQERLDAESQLTEVIRLTESPTGEHLVEVAELLTRLQGAGERVKLARRFHNEAVSETRQVRGHRLVRALRLAGSARVPLPINFDDDWPREA